MVTEKRFTVKDDVGMLDVACANIFDNGEFIGTVPLFDAEKFVDLLNDLHDKNDRFEFILQEAIRTERTDMGKNVLIQLADNLGVKYE